MTNEKTRDLLTSIEKIVAIGHSSETQVTAKEHEEKVGIILQSQLDCENIDNLELNNKFKIKKYENIEIEKLNVNIINNLVKKNDAVFIENSNKNLLILLCDINYDSKLASNLLEQKNIDKEIYYLEKEFIETNKKIFNFIMFN